MTSSRQALAWRNLAFATVSFTLCFAAWGLVSAFAPPLPRIHLIEEDGWIVAVGVDLQEAEA